MNAPAGDSNPAPIRRLRLVPPGANAEVVDPSLLTARDYAVAAIRTVGYRPTEYGNAQRLALLFGRDIRYVGDEHRWYVWSGTHWAPDVDGQLMRCAKTVARLILNELPNVDHHDREAWARHAKSSETRRGLQAMIDLAASERITVDGIDMVLTCSARDFDTHPLLLNCANGTLDLRTGDLQAHNRTDMLRRITPVAYEPDARSSMWEEFLTASLGDDVELQDFLQLLAGATVLGVNDHDLIPVLYGPPASGKSTFLGALQAALGPDYSTTANIETFTAHTPGDAPREDIARLEGRRMVSCVEVEHAQTLAVGLLKRMAGGDELTARALYQPSRTFRPQLTVWLAVNDLPRVPKDEAGLWRRVKVIPFENQVLAVDRTLRSRLSEPTSNGRAVLAWMVAGAVRLHQHTGDLVDPHAVAESTSEYREDNVGSPLEAWLATCCRHAEPDVLTPTKELRASYEAHCQATREMPVGLKAWGMAMGRNFAAHRSKAARYYRGIELAPPG